MCILSVYRKEDSFIITHNRDEHKDRKSSDTLRTKIIDGQEVSFPVDLQSQGTWIATSQHWTTAILNGAFNSHIHNPPYRHSRGLFPLMLMSYNSVIDYFEDLNLIGIEPFTQIIIQHSDNELYRLTWDGIDKNFQKIDSEMFVTSSSTLYNANQKSMHKRSLCSLEDLSSANLAHLHEKLKWSNRDDHPYVKTTSLTQIIKDSKEKIMYFKNYTNYI